MAAWLTSPKAAPRNIKSSEFEGQSASGAASARSASSGKGFKTANTSVLSDTTGDGEEPTTDGEDESPEDAAHLKNIAQLQWMAKLRYMEVRPDKDAAKAPGCRTVANKYCFYSKEGLKIADAKEKGKFCRMCCGQFCFNRRGFALRVKSASVGDSFVVQRRFKPLLGVCPPCLPCLVDGVEVNGLDGEMLAECSQVFAMFRTKFSVKDHKDVQQYTVQGPICRCGSACCFKNQKFSILDRKGAKVGRIFKKWSNMVFGLMDDPDTFVLETEHDPPLPLRAALVGLAFLIDVMYLETAEAKRNKTRRPSSDEVDEGREEEDAQLGKKPKGTKKKPENIDSVEDIQVKKKPKGKKD